MDVDGGDVTHNCFAVLIDKLALTLSGKRALLQ